MATVPGGWMRLLATDHESSLVSVESLATVKVANTMYLQLHNFQSKLLPVSILREQIFKISKGGMPQKSKQEHSL